MRPWDCRWTGRKMEWRITSRGSRLDVRAPQQMPSAHTGVPGWSAVTCFDDMIGRNSPRNETHFFPCSRAPQCVYSLLGVCPCNDLRVSATSRVYAIITPIRYSLFATPSTTPGPWLDSRYIHKRAQTARLWRFVPDLPTGRDTAASRCPPPCRRTLVSGAFGGRGRCEPPASPCVALARAQSARRAACFSRQWMLT